MENRKKIHTEFFLFAQFFISLSVHHLMHKYLEEKNINGYEIDSCGTIAYGWESPFQYNLNLL